MNTTIIKSTIAIVFSMVLVAVAVAVMTINASAQEQTAVPITTDATTDTSNQTEVVTGTYDFTAQPGDSYTKMARKAVQIYGIETSTNLSGEQIVFAETNLTLTAGSPALNVGQNVTFEKSAVAEWVKKASELTSEQQAAWTPYVAYVNFDTNSIGQ